MNNAGRWPDFVASVLRAATAEPGRAQRQAMSRHVARWSPFGGPTVSTIDPAGAARALARELVDERAARAVGEPP